MNRRTFIQYSAITGGVAGLSPALAANHLQDEGVVFEISLAQWSLRSKLFKKKLDNLDFPAYTKNSYGIKAVEYVSQFFPEKITVSEAYAKQLAQRAEDEGVRNVLIMVDYYREEGKLASPKAKTRKLAAENHQVWIDAAKILGCHAIRVNAFGYEKEATYAEAQEDFVDGLGRLVEYASKEEIVVMVENHGGYSSNGKWLVEVMEKVNSPYCATLPDFGNFRISKDEQYDPYQGVEELMPFAKGVSAKSMVFDEAGNEANLDYRKLMKIVKDSGFKGFVGIEWGGKGDMEEAEVGIKATKALLEKVIAEM